MYTKCMEINGTDIYKRIIQMIELRGIKTNDFYDKIGITRQNLSKWKAGSLPSADVLFLIKEELNVSLDWLLTGINEQDTLSPTEPYRIVDRIEDLLKKDSKLEGRWMPGFYERIKDIVKPYELNDWRDHRQNIDITKITKIADRLGESVQYLITGAHISKAEYTEKYFGNKESEDANFYRTFSCLGKDKKEVLKHIATLYFNEQINQNEKK